MRSPPALRRRGAIALLLLVALVVLLQCEFGACYKTEVEITPAPPADETTKKSGFFSGFKNFFRGSSDSTTTTPAPPVANVAPAPQQPPAGTSSGVHIDPPRAPKPPPLNVNLSPLQPLGPRPDTPSTSPFGGGNPHQPPQWPQPGTPTAPQHSPAAPIGGSRPGVAQVPYEAHAQQTQHQQQRPGVQPSTYPGFGPYQPARNQPSGVDLSYGGGGGFGTGGKQPPPGARPGFGLSPMPATGSGSSTPPAPAAPAAPLRPGQPQTPLPATPVVPLRPGQPHPPPPPPPPPPKQLDFDMRIGGGSSGPTTGFGSTAPTPKSPVGNGVKGDYPALPSPRRPSTPGSTGGGIKDDFPALPAPKSPSPIPASPLRPSSPSAWNSPLPTPASPPSGSTAFVQKPGAPTPPPASSSTASGGGGAADGSGVSFVPHTPAATDGGATRPASALAADDEIRTLTEQLYTKEVNNQLNLIHVNPQGKTRSIDSTDEAPQPLLAVDAKALEPLTLAKMQALFNNYEQDTTVNEHVTAMEHKEENDFVDAVMSTAVMRQAMLFLQNKNIIGPDPKTHRDMVKELWFTQYSRGGGRIGSSGFEHVFVNEVKNGTIIGLHNWVYFSEEEKAGRLDYKGYLNQLDLGTKAKVMKVRFTHNGLNKPVNTMFIGTSPELELALYTVCFKLRPDSTCPVSLGNARFGIVTYSWRYRGKSLIGSAYPEI